eukprot:COSAG01_NODE_7718_length_3085_cov_2.157066_3_plen_79_part_00
MVDFSPGSAEVYRRGCGAEQVLSKFLGLAFEQGLLAQVRVERPPTISHDSGAVRGRAIDQQQLSAVLCVCDWLYYYYV